MNPPAQWLPDPQNPSQVRYWDGNSWTNYTQANPAVSQQVQPQQSVMGQSQSGVGQYGQGGQQPDVGQYGQGGQQPGFGQVVLPQPAAAVASPNSAGKGADLKEKLVKNKKILLALLVAIILVFAVKTVLGGGGDTPTPAPTPAGQTAPPASSKGGATPPAANPATHK